ncbi:hypothetical protein [Pseudomonas viridiflava]|uniref:hypothetical protein n=1 Tax=Pseudomonas viridiflava TaxID=33069 RepID=UPI000F01D416|nr:hypothetical protein [Pseudomonas viridiflava]
MDVDSVTDILEAIADVKLDPQGRSALASVAVGMKDDASFGDLIELLRSEHQDLPGLAGTDARFLDALRIGVRSFDFDAGD